MELTQVNYKKASNVYAVLGTINLNITDEELFDKVINAVIERYKFIYIKRYQKKIPITKELILEQNRGGHFVYFRQLICYYLRSEKLKLQKIGKLMQRDHTTIIHSVNAFKDRIDTLARIPEKIIVDSKNTQEDYKSFRKLF